MGAEDDDDGSNSWSGRRRLHYGNQLRIFLYPGIRSFSTTTPWAIETCHFYFYDNFGKCGPISMILSLLDS